MPKISVITPVYNVSRFIEKCAKSLLEQTYKDAEFIFVDDASSDGSIKLLEEVIRTHYDVDARILHHIENKGLPSSRKTGIEAATGEYVFNCDGDDWVEPDLLEELVKAVDANNADYAYCDFYLSYENSERYMHNPAYSTADEMLRKGFLCGSAKYNVWNKLIRRTLYEGVEFPVDHKKGGEDMIMIGMLSKAKSIAYVNKALYHYVKTNSSAISESFSPQRLIDIQYNAGNAIRILQETYPADLTKEIALFKLNVKLPFLISTDRDKYRIWQEWYPEANEYVMENQFLPYRTKVLQWMASRNMWFGVLLYNVVVYKLLYKIKYL